MLRLLSLFLLLLMVTTLLGGHVARADLPGGAVWYLHANLEQMRTTDSGREFYAWFEKEAGADLKEEFGVDLSTEIDRVTAFSGAVDEAAVVVEGPISEAFTKKLEAIAVLKGDLEKRRHGGRSYFAFQETAPKRDDAPNAAFFSFDVDGKILAARGETALIALMDANGRIPAAGARDDTVFPLSPEKSYVQAAVEPERFVELLGDDDWNSRILRNTEQAVLLVSDQSGAIAINARLTSSDANMTQSLANIISGLLSLQAFNDDLDEPIARVLRSTIVDVDDEVLSINALIEPTLLMELLEN